MPTYVTADGKRYVTDTPLSPEALDELMAHTDSNVQNNVSQISPMLKGGLLDSSLPITERLKRVFTGQPDQNIVGPGFMKIPGVEAAGNYIKNKMINTGNYYAGVAGSVIGDLVSGAASALDPRAVATGKGEILDPDARADFLATKHGPLEPVKPIEPQAQQASSLEIPEPKSGTPPFNTAQFGLKPTVETNPLLSHVPNRLRPPSTNATVFDALLPEKFKVNEQGAAVPLTQAFEHSPDKHAIAESLFPEGDAPPLQDAERAVHSSTPEAQTTAAPGNVIPKPSGGGDVPAWLAYSGSADQILENKPATQGIVTAIRDNGWDKMQQAIGTQIRQLGDITQGLNKDQLQAFGRTAEGIATDLDKQALSAIPDLEVRLTKYRDLMDDIFEQAKVARKGDLGYIQDYVTHVQQEPEDFGSALKEIFNYRQGRNAWKAMTEAGDLSPKGTGEASGIYDQGTGAIGESGFTKERTGALDNLDYNVNKLGRMYIESMARETYLRPAVDEAKKIVEGLPDSKLKELSEWYIRNVTQFDSAPQLHSAMRKVVNAMINTTSRSFLALNPHLQALHAMRLGPVYAELGPKYSASGLGNMLRQPIQAYREAAELGLLPNELIPPRFRTFDEKIDSFGNYKSIIDFVDRTIAYNGSKARYLDQGLSEPEAIKQAIVDTKRMTFQTDPTRANMTLNPQDPFWKLGAQFKQVPAKVAEMLVRTAAEAKQNPARARRMLALLGASGASYAAGGPNLFHMPMTLTDWTFASTKEVAKILSYAYKGDLDKAVGEAALWLTPAGKSLQRLFQ